MGLFRKKKIEKGREVSEKIIFRLAKALDVSVAYLMGIDESIVKSQHQQNDVFLVITRLYKDDDFFELTKTISNLNSTQMLALKQFLEVFSHNG